jgi:hypothetical protein
MNNPFNEESTQIYVGEKRSGKTLSMVADTYDLIKNLENPPIIYANLQLNKKYFPSFKYITKEDLESFYKSKNDFKKCFFLIDEGHIFMDSRKFMKDGIQKIGYLIGQMGKRGNIMKINTHFPRFLDIRIRLYCEKWIYVSKLYKSKDNKLSMIKNYNAEIKKEDEKNIYILCEPVIRKLQGFDFVNTPLQSYMLKANKYFNLYDTEEMITSDT